MEKKIYSVALGSTEAVIRFPIELTEDEADLVRRLAALFKAESHGYGPTLEIYEVTNQ